MTALRTRALGHVVVSHMPGTPHYQASNCCTPLLLQMRTSHIHQCTASPPLTRGGWSKPMPLCWAWLSHTSCTMSWLGQVTRSTPCSANASRERGQVAHRIPQKALQTAAAGKGQRVEWLNLTSFERHDEVEARLNALQPNARTTTAAEELLVHVCVRPRIMSERPEQRTRQK